MFILTEKPSVAKDIASALGGFTYNKAGCYVSKNGDCIVPAAGHLLSLFMPEDYDAKYEKWSLVNLPDMLCHLSIAKHEGGIGYRGHVIFSFY